MGVGVEVEEEMHPLGMTGVDPFGVGHSPRCGWGEEQEVLCEKEGEEGHL